MAIPDDDENDDSSTRKRKRNSTNPSLEETLEKHSKAVLSDKQDSTSGTAEEDEDYTRLTEALRQAWPVILQPSPKTPNDDDDTFPLLAKIQNVIRRLHLAFRILFGLHRTAHSLLIQ